MSKNLRYRQYLAAAYRQAAKSVDPSSQVGAVVISHDAIIGQSCNYFLVDDIDLLDRNQRLRFVQHAESGAIFDSIANMGCSLTWCEPILFAPWAACIDCAKTIVGCGVRELVRHTDRMLLTKGGPWDENIETADRILSANKVLITEVSGPIEAPPILASGRLWSPQELNYVASRA